MKNGKNDSYTGCLALEDGSIFWGNGFGSNGVVAGELCFQTAMTGYQEVLTDPSYSGQLVVFSFPYIGNTGVTSEDDESHSVYVKGIVVRNAPTEPSNWRSQKSMYEYCKQNSIIGISDVDTRKLVSIIRNKGMQKAVVAHLQPSEFDADTLVKMARDSLEMNGKELACVVSRERVRVWENQANSSGFSDSDVRAVIIDFGVKQSIINHVESQGCRAIVLPANTDFDTIMSYKPHGILLSNGPGDPESTFLETSLMLNKIIYETDIPVMGICLGHQILALALGGRTSKMSLGHHGVNHPVKDIATGKVFITSMNHGFSVDVESLPSNVIQTHISLFDGSNCGIRVKDREAFSVQYHPEGAPGPNDSIELFHNFFNSMNNFAARSA